MNWISAKDKLPEYEKIMLLWAHQGHRWGWHIGALHNMNGDNGYTEWIGLGGRTLREPNKEYPNNLEWNIGGHWLDFEKVLHWVELTNPGDKQT